MLTDAPPALPSGMVEDVKQMRTIEVSLKRTGSGSTPTEVPVAKRNEGQDRDTVHSHGSASATLVLPDLQVDEVNGQARIATCALGASSSLLGDCERDDGAPLVRSCWYHCV